LQYDSAMRKEMIFRTKSLILLLVITVAPAMFSFTPQEARVNQKKIEREREKKQKKDKKQYDKAVKQHKNNQSKATKKSMKQTKKESKNATPIKRK
jgi:hypothetical protein